MRIYATAVNGQGVSTTRQASGGWRSVAFDLTNVEGEIVGGDICLDSRRSAVGQFVAGDADANFVFASTVDVAGNNPHVARLAMNALGVDVLNTCVGGYLQVDIWTGDTRSPQPRLENHPIALELRSRRAVATPRAA